MRSAPRSIALHGAALLLVMAAPAARAADGADPLFASLEPVALHISAPLNAMARDRADDPEYRQGTLTLPSGQDPAGAAATTFQIKIRPRGNSRRDRSVCKFPPLRVNFKKSEVQGTLFHGQDKLKLVTHCRSGDRHTEYVYKEYLVYRMLNQLTDAGFRVRPLRISYVDSDRGDDEGTHFGFFIEHKNRLARRLDLKPIEPDRIDHGRLEPMHASLMDLFQFMIGNTDYSFIAAAPGESCCHNATLMENADGRVLPMPYDFDITGFVDPPYAVVDGQLPIRNVRTRLYRGLCRDDDSHQRAVDRFRAGRDAILEPVRSETDLDQRDRRRAVDYVLGFYEVLENPRKLEREVYDACRG